MSAVPIYVAIRIQISALTSIYQTRRPACGRGTVALPPGCFGRLRRQALANGKYLTEWNQKILLGGTLRGLDGKVIGRLPGEGSGRLPGAAVADKGDVYLCPPSGRGREVHQTIQSVL
jgi:hypothetical protein